MAPTGLGFDAVRRTNLATVLQHVHYAGSISRADLGRATGLNRSTIIGLASELQDRGLIVERPPAVIPNRDRGRPSALLEPDKSVATLVAHVDVSDLIIALVSLGGTVLARTHIAVNDPVSVHELAQILAIERPRLEATLDRLRVVHGAVALSALVSADSQVVISAPQVGWKDEPVGKRLTDQLGLPMSVVNDALASGTAEMRFGTARGLSDVLYVQGTDHGISCGIFVDGEPLRGSQGYAGQLGFNLVSPPRGTAGRITARTVNDEVTRRELLRAMGNEEATDDDIQSALYEGEPAATRTIGRRQAEILSLVLANVTNMMNPEAIVLNGFVAALYGSDPGYLTTLVRRQCLPESFEGLTILRSSLGPDAVLLGAAEEAFSTLLATADPRDARRN